MWHGKHLGVILGLVLMLALMIAAVQGFGTREAGAMPDNLKPMAAPGALSKAEIERLALERAQFVGLQGAHTKITSKQMTLDEARRRMGAAVYESRDPNTPVWLVVIRGSIHMRLARPPLQGDAQPPGYDNMYLLLDTAGQISAFGSKTDGRSPAVDLGAPVPGGPVPYWSTPIIVPVEEMPQPGGSPRGPTAPEPKPTSVRP